MPHRSGIEQVTLITPAVWPPEGDVPVYLACDTNATEREVLESAVRRLGPEGAELVWSGAAAIEAARDGTRPIVPLRVLWLAAGQTDQEDAPVRLAGLRDVSRAAAPSSLLASRQRRILVRHPDRCRVVVGASATVRELEARWRERTGTPGRTTSDSSGPASGAGGDLAAFVERAAEIALERAERAVTGDRYRAPRRVVDEILEDRRFQEAAEELAGRLGRTPAGVVADARAYLEEFSTEQNRAARDVWVRWSRFLHRAYELKVDPEQIERIRELSAKHPLVFLPSHRSNLDGYVMAALLHDHGLPPNHTLGGINMAFWPIGPIGRRVGVIWIRRTFKSNEIYKFTLRRYLGFLVEKRFNLEWYIEGGRSRTGKLLPPRLGLFNYLADAVDELGIDDVHLVPVSIVYDELQEVAEVTAESRGKEKPKEGIGWLLSFARSQRGAYGSAHVTFGEPLVLSEALRERDPGGPEEEAPDRRRLARSKVAFEVCTRINRATPVTPTSLVALALLGGEDRALTIDELTTALEPLLQHVRARDIPGLDRAEALTTPDGVRAALATLQGNGVVELHSEGPDTVVRIGPAQELVAAFYRNTAIHWFLSRAIVELGLLGAVERGEVDDPFAVALEDAFAIRDLLKFEFFFPEKAEYKAELQAELAMIDPSWRDHGPDRIMELGESAARSGALMAHRVLRSFVEAYLIVADDLARQGDATVGDDEVVRRALHLGRQYRLQRVVTSEEALSTHLFRSALKLARNRGLVEGRPGVGEGRVAFAEELRDLQRRLRGIAAFDRTRARARGGVTA